LALRRSARSHNRTAKSKARHAALAPARQDFERFLAAHVRNIDRSERVVAQHLEQHAGLLPQQGALGEQGGQRALQAAQIQLFRVGFWIVNHT